MAWPEKDSSLALRKLLEENYPQAKTLADLDIIGGHKPTLHKKQNVDQEEKELRECGAQTIERIYTFPVELPTALTSDSVSWGEPIIKNANMSLGELWHARLGHASDKVMTATSEAYPQVQIPKKHVTNKIQQPALCECCAKCKANIKRKIPKSNHKVSRYLERVHMDVCGPLQMKTYDGCQYFTVFVDEYTKYKWVYVHKDRTTSVEILRRFILDATKGTELKIACLRADQAKEHLAKGYRKELKKHDISLECSCAYFHYQIGMAEKSIRDICTMARCMIEYGKVARDMWGYAVRYAAYVQNRIVHAGMEMCPYEMRYDELPDLEVLKVFGCAAYITRDKKETDYVLDPKLDPRGAMGCFVGMAEDGGEFEGAAVKGYMVWTLETGARMVVSPQVRFDETCYPQLMGVTEWEFSLRTQVEKCKATINSMTFETEPLYRHPILLDEEEKKYREDQQKTLLNPQRLVGLKVKFKREGKRHESGAEGYIYNYIEGYKVWGVALVKQQEAENQESETEEDGLVYVTIADLADSETIEFEEDGKVIQQIRKKAKKGKKESAEVRVNLLKLNEEVDLLKYDKSTRDTQTIIDRIVYARETKTQKAPISRHEPEPKTWKQAMNTMAAQKWFEAAKAEVDGLQGMGTWIPVRPIPGVKPIDSKWVFKIKYNTDGTIEKYKGRLVVRGDSQKAGIDYGEVFSPVAHNTMCRMLLSMANACDFEVDLVDVCQAFLNAPLEEEIYMRPAPGVTDILGIPPDSWLKLKRNLYGLKQAPRNWSLTFTKWMLEKQAFTKASIDDCLFYKEFKHNGKDVFILLLMYVDDNIIISNDRECLDKFKADMHEEFKIVDKKDIKTYLGVQIERDRKAKTLKMHQTAYLNEILSAMNIKPDDPVTYPTPLPQGVSLVKNEGQPYELDLYRSVIGSLIYLSTWTRIDIAYAVSALAAHMSNPSRDHHVALKHLLHYLHGTRDKGITYHANDVHGINKLYGFVDADYAGDPNSRRSRSGYVMMMNSGCISWRTKLQTVIAHSTTDAEVYAASVAIKEIIYLRDALRRIGLPQAEASDPSKGTILYEDNEATTAIARSAAHREATKHMAIARSFLRYHHENGTVCFVDCYTTMQLADFLTKSLGPQNYKKLIAEAMGDEMKTDVTKYARRNWREQYEEKLQQRAQADIDEEIDVMRTYVHRNDDQREVLKYEFHNLVYCNCMRVPIYANTLEGMSLTIEEHIRGDQHRSNILTQVEQEDLKATKGMYGKIIL